MVQMVGLAAGTETALRRLMARMTTDGLPLGGLARVEWRRMDDYHGLVKPIGPAGGGPFACTLYLATDAPFTMAHELAHVADIALRHDETAAHLTGTRTHAWHMAHRMSSEYFANRVATRYCDDAQIFPAFQNDRIGMVKAARDGDWAATLVNYAMLLGIFHGLGRLDVEPLELLPDADLERLPPAVTNGMAGFRNAADDLFRHIPAALSA